MKPLTMLEFVQESNGLESIKNYAKFLAQKPKKWMFVPCDENGNVLEEPIKENYLLNHENQNNKGNIVDLVKYTKDFNNYQQALERVIFEGFASPHKDWVESEFLYFSMSEDFKTIEDLINMYGDFLTLKKPIQ